MVLPYPSDAKLKKQTGVGYLRDLLSAGAFEVDTFEDKFWGDALRDEYPAAKTNGTAAAVTFTEHNANGYVELVSGTADNGYGGQGLGHQFTGDRGCLAEFIVVLPAAITTMKFEVGFTDADDDAGAVNVKATPSVTATDCAVFVFDTDDDTNIGFVSAKAGTAVASQDIQAAAVSTTYRFAVRIQGDAVTAYINGTEVTTAEHVIEGGNALTPWAFCQARAASASRTVQLHKWRVQQPAY